MSRRATVTVFGVDVTVYVKPREHVDDVVERAERRYLEARYGRGSFLYTSRQECTTMDGATAYYAGTVVGPPVRPNDRSYPVRGELRWSTARGTGRRNDEAVRAAGGVA